MTPELLPATHCVGIGRRVFQQLRSSLERDAGLQTAQYLQEAGFAGGAELYAAFSTWLDESYGLKDPGDLDQAFLNEVLTKFFTQMGWGPLTAKPLGDAVLALDAIEWAEAGDEGGQQVGGQFAESESVRWR